MMNSYVDWWLLRVVPIEMAPLHCFVIGGRRMKLHLSSANYSLAFGWNVPSVITTHLSVGVRKISIRLRPIFRTLDEKALVCRRQFPEVKKWFWALKLEVLSIREPTKF